MFPSSPSVRIVRLVVLVLALAMLWVLVGPGATTARGAETRQHWDRATVTVRDETGYPDYRRAISLAVDRWNAAGANVRLALANGRGEGCDNPRPGEVPVCRAVFSGSQAGEAWVWNNGAHVTRASVLLDSRSRPFEQLAAIACHELGHALGRTHRAEASSCMTAVVRSTAPDQRDLSELRDDHRHSPHPTAQPAPAPSGGTSSGDASCGTLLVVRAPMLCGTERLVLDAHDHAHDHG